MGYDQLADRMDSLVYEHLGNDVSYARGGGLFKSIKGFVLLAAEAENQELNYIDPMNKNDRLKVSKTIIPEVTSADRIKHPKLDGVMRPSNWVTATDGRDWLIDLQKA